MKLTQDQVNHFAEIVFYDIYDTDRSGFIDYSEIYKLKNDLIREYERFFEEQQIDYKITPEEIDEAFDKIQDGLSDDGRVSLDEFKDAMSSILAKNPSISF